MDPTPDPDALLATMTLEEKVGQLFMLAFAGERLDEARVLIEEHFVGACYLGNDNLPTPAAAAALTDSLQRYAAATRLGLPLLLCPDQEGTWGVMVPHSATGPGNLGLGATGRPDDARAVYRTIGRELRSVGLNTLLAPCADCNSNPHNSIIGMRSFGERPDAVGAMTAAAVAGAREGGVLATLKHFPGHGDTISDSHRGLPTVDRSREELFAIDLEPFARGVEAGAELVMTAHIVFSALDDRPATLSPVVLGEVLRGELGFGGVIVSDSMNMRAMKAHYRPEDSAVGALAAGVDVIMLAEEHYDHDAARYLDDQIALLGAVAEAVRSGALPEARVDDAVRRVLTLKAELPPVALRPEEVGSPAHRQLEREVAGRAVAVLRDEAGHLPLDPAAPITLVNTTARSAYAVLGATRGIGPNQTTPAFDLFAEALRERAAELRVLSAEEVLGGAALPPSGMIVAVTENHTLPGMDFDQSSQRPTLERLLEAAGERLVVVALRDPYELARLPALPTYLCAFSFRPCAAEAAAAALVGESAVAGKSPVSVPGAGVEA